MERSLSFLCPGDMVKGNESRQRLVSVISTSPSPIFEAKQAGRSLASELGSLSFDTRWFLIFHCVFVTSPAIVAAEIAIPQHAHLPL